MPIITSSSRYDKKNFIEILTTDYDLVQSKFIEYMLRLGNISKIRINGQFSYRIDLISRAVYNTPDLWWILMAVNSILYIEEIANLREIYYIPIRDVESAYFKYKEFLT